MGNNPLLKAALISGVVAGVIDSIPFVNYCCCVWLIGCGFLGAYLYWKNNGMFIDQKSSLYVGALGGLIASILYSIIAVFTISIFGSKMTEQMMTQSDRPIPQFVIDILSSPALLILITICISLIGFTLLMTIGGYIGYAILKKKNTPQMEELHQ
jgi:hypothetical protein